MIVRRYRSGSDRGGGSRNPGRRMPVAGYRGRMPSVTIVAHVIATAPEALVMIAKTVRSHVEGAGSANASVPLPMNARASVTVAGFGDELPVAIDVEAPTVEEAKAAASALRLQLKAGPGWRMESGNGA
jgi:hypothetical protein